MDVTRDPRTGLATGWIANAPACKLSGAHPEDGASGLLTDRASGSLGGSIPPSGESRPSIRAGLMGGSRCLGAIGVRSFAISLSHLPSSDVLTDSRTRATESAVKVSPRPVPCRRLTVVPATSHLVSRMCTGLQSRHEAYPSCEVGG